MSAAYCPFAAPLFAASDWPVYEFPFWPGFWVFIGLWLGFGLAVGFYLASRRDCAACSRKEALRRSALLAAVVAPSVMPVGFGGVYAPALAVFVQLTVAGISGGEYRVALPILLLCGLPWLVCTGLIYWIWSARVRSTPENPAGRN